MALDLAEIEAAIRAAGLDPRGGFHVEAGDVVPVSSNGAITRTLVLVGNLGGAFWQTFASSPEFALADDPLDGWTRRVLTGVAVDLGATAVFPFGGPPHHPFQRWAMRAEPVHRSPLGLLIHPDYGLWHAYRGALLFGDAIALPAPVVRANPCATCFAKPCLSACPVSAFTSAGYDVAGCVAHVEGDGGECRDGGCLARQACPIAVEQSYSAGQQRFHMAAFLAARRAAR